MTAPVPDPRLIRLAEPDNVLIISASLEAGDEVSIDGQSITMPQALSLGHKLAARPIAAGQTVLKYNFPIGIATADIPTGAHVHVHNMRSDYTPTYIIPEA